MKTRFVGPLLALLLAGCSDAGKEVEPPGGKSPATDVTATSPESADRTAETASDSAATAHSPADAEKLLASTLATAKADNKRVLVHLGAPW